jgi:hypothetical protein
MNIIDYVQIYFYNFLKVGNVILFFKMKVSVEVERKTHFPPSLSLPSYSVLRVSGGRPGRSRALSGSFAGRRRQRGGAGVVPYSSSLVVSFPFVEFGVLSPDGVPPTPVGRVARPVVVLTAAARAWCLWLLLVCVAAPPLNKPSYPLQVPRSGAVVSPPAGRGGEGTRFSSSSSCVDVGWDRPAVGPESCVPWSSQATTDARRH